MGRIDRASAIRRQRAEKYFVAGNMTDERRAQIEKDYAQAKARWDAGARNWCQPSQEHAVASAVLIEAERALKHAQETKLP